MHLARTAKQLGAIVQRERKSRSLSQAELGARIGLRQATISKLEAGEPGTQLRTLLDALTALNLQIVVEERSSSDHRDIENLF